MELLGTAEATATGGGQNGRARSSDAGIDLPVNPQSRSAAPAKAATQSSCSQPATPPASTTPSPWSPAVTGSSSARPW